MSTLATLYGACETGAAILEKSKWVFDRCASYRRDEFFRTLQEDLQIEMASGVTEHSVDDALNRLLATEDGQELLFDAFRRVCFAKSRTYGPRIIGLLTAQLLNECRKSTEEEDMIFAAAESLSDGEFTAFEKEYDSVRNPSAKSAAKITLKNDEIAYVHFDSWAETGRRTSGEMEAASPNLHEFYGSWAGKLEQSGLIRQDSRIRQGVSDSDFERDVEETPYMAFESTLIYRPACLRLFNLLRRAKSIAHSA